MSQDNSIDIGLIFMVLLLFICIVGLIYCFFMMMFYSSGLIGTSQIVEETNSTGIENVQVTGRHLIIEPEESDNLRTVYVLGEDNLEETKKKLSPDQSEIKFKYYRNFALIPINEKTTYNIVIEDKDGISHKQIEVKNSIL